MCEYRREEASEATSRLTDTLSGASDERNGPHMRTSGLRRPRALSRRVLAGFSVCLLALCFLECLPAWAQVGTTGSVPTAIRSEDIQNPLGRNTPREESKPALADDVVPKSLVKTRIAGVALYHWLAAFVGMPLVYYVVTLSSRLLGVLIGLLRRRLFRKPDLTNPEVLPKPIRLLLLAFIIHWTISRVGLSLFAWKIWSSIATVITISASVWLLILMTGWTERYVRRLLVRRQITGVTAIVRLVRGVIDLLFIVAGVLVTHYRFGWDPTVFLTGLGLGGIAVALAAQRTLENVIGGVCLILDRVVRLGDTIALGDIQGTIEAISLRSTRIRTLDRTVVSVPNGQMANMTLENFSTRDKFWFHPILALRCGTTAAQIRTVIYGIGSLLEQSRDVAPDSVRVHFRRFTQASFEVEVFAYVLGRDWKQFLEIQERLLLRITECFESAGVQIAVPLQTTVAYDAITSRKNARIDRSSA